MPDHQSIAYRALRQSRFRWSAWCLHPIHPGVWVFIGDRLTRSRAVRHARSCALDFERMDGIHQLWVDGAEMRRIGARATEEVFGRFAETFGVELPDG